MRKSEKFLTRTQKTNFATPALGKHFFFLMIVTCCKLEEVVVLDTYANTLWIKIIQGSGGSGKYIHPVGRSVGRHCLERDDA